MKKILILLLALSFSPLLQGEEAATEPGFADFSMLEDVYGEPRVMINIGGPLLKFMAMASQDEPETAELMRNLKAIRVNVYDTAGDVAPAREQITTVRKMLEQGNWMPVVQVNEQDEEVQIFMQGDETRMDGLTVMAVNDEEAVFINILGQIDPGQIDKVMKRINVDVDVDVSDEEK